MVPALLLLLLASTSAPVVELTVEPAEDLGDSFQLELDGMVATRARGEPLFLFGALRGPGRSAGALLLRSVDGGSHWREVLPQVGNSAVLFVESLGCELRALVGWTAEGPGEVTLFASTDCGATWSRRSEVPKSIWSQWPAAMRWKNAQQGTVWLVDTAGEEGSPARALQTRDGGRTWRPVHTKPPPDEERHFERLVAPRSAGGQWALLRGPGHLRFEVLRGGSPPELRALIPVSWTRSGKALIPAAGDPKAP